MQIDIFNKTVKPVLLYGCEIWGFGNLEILERVQLKFLKYILNVRKSTPSCIIYGETGVTPIKIDIHTRMISYWSKIVSQDQNKLSYNVYQVMLSLFNNSRPDTVKKKFGWLECIKSILVNCGNINIWQQHNFPNSKWLKASVGQKLKDLFINEWYNTIETSRSCTTYRLFKEKFEFEKYLINTPHKYLRFVIKFRTGNNKMPIIIGRWNNVNRENRICILCNQDIGDEFHYLFNCNAFSNTRKQYINSTYYTRPNILKFKSLMNISNKILYRKLCEFIKLIILRFK